jgi:DNA-directed RNA polymerase subunit M/transcription elongation factor TFIIS
MKHSTKTYSCKNCGIENKVSYQSFNIYCSKKCNGEGQRKDTVERFNRGEVKDRDTLRRMLREINGNTCESCNIPGIHNNAPITLQVDHKDGNAGNNIPANLRLICPNCHSQTATFGARNKGNGRKARGLPLK